MHQLIASPFLGDHMVLRPGERRGIRISRAAYAELTRAEVFPVWLADAARRIWGIEFRQEATAGRLLVRPESAHPFGKATYELNLGCNYDCEHCYLGLKTFEGLEWSGRERLLEAIRDAGVLWLQLTGGEPMVDRQFAAVHAKAYELGMMIEILTNGSRLANDRMVRGLIEKHAGAVVSARPVKDGFNSEVAVVVNGTTFVKGLRADHPRVRTQERERRINPHVRHVSARLLWAEISGGWDLNGFEFLDGHQASYERGSHDLGRIAAMMARWPPAPEEVGLKYAPDRWASYSDRAELFAGEWLSHTDWSPGNVLIVDRQARMLDWAWPTKAVRWLDPACWVVWLIASGHTPGEAEAHASKVPAFAMAPREAVSAFASAQAAMWEDIGEHAPRPGLAAAAAGWVKYRAD